MRLQSTGLILTILAFASACSQGNYAQVEPDDLYFTHKDRKEVNTSFMASAAPATSYDYNNATVASYTSQHSPTLYSTSVGSPTIQTNEQFYDATQNPDYVSVSTPAVDEGGSDYFVEDYALGIVETTEDTPPVTINNYNYGVNPYSSFYPGSSFITLSFSYGYGSFYNPWSPYYNPFYASPFNYNPYGNNYYGYYDPWYSPNYGSYPNYGSGAYCYYPVIVGNQGNSYNSGNSNYNYNASYADGTRIINAPRRSRTTVSDYTGSQHDIRRSNRGQKNDDSGIIVLDKNNNGRWASEVPKEKSINSTKDSRTIRTRRTNNRDISSSSPTIQSGNKRVIKTRTRTSSYSSNRRSSWNTGNSQYRSNNNRYSSPTRNQSGNSYNRSRSNSSYTPSRSSYSPTRSSNSGRSSYSPSRSRSSSPSRSTARPSSGSSRSTTRKN